MTRQRIGRLLATGAAVLALGGLAACSDEDGDGAVTDEEVDQIDESVEDMTDTIQEEIDEGVDEVEE